MDYHTNNVNQSILKFLGVKQIFLTTLPKSPWAAAGEGGADSDPPKGKSDREAIWPSAGRSWRSCRATSAPTAMCGRATPGDTGGGETRFGAHPMPLDLHKKWIPERHTHFDRQGPRVGRAGIHL